MLFVRNMRRSYLVRNHTNNTYHRATVILSISIYDCIFLYVYSTIRYYDQSPRVVVTLMNIICCCAMPSRVKICDRKERLTTLIVYKYTSKCFSFITICSCGSSTNQQTENWLKLVFEKIKPKISYRSYFFFLQTTSSLFHYTHTRARVLTHCTNSIGYWAK